MLQTIILQCTNYIKQITEINNELLTNITDKTSQEIKILLEKIYILRTILCEFGHIFTNPLDNIIHKDQHTLNLITNNQLYAETLPALVSIGHTNRAIIVKTDDPYYIPISKNIYYSNIILQKIFQPKLLSSLNPKNIKFMLDNLLNITFLNNTHIFTVQIENNDINTALTELQNNEIFQKIQKHTPINKLNIQDDYNSQSLFSDKQLNKKHFTIEDILTIFSQHITNQPTPKT